MHIHLNKAIIRVPLLGLNKLEEVRLDDLSAFRIFQQLRQLCTPEIIEALYISSPDYSALLEALLQKDEHTISYVKLLDIWLSFVKYYTRMCSRSTPYGLMASVGVISLEPTSRIQDEFKGTVHMQLDNAVAAAIALQLESSSTVLQKHLHYFPNPSIYRHAKQLKYFEILNHNGNKAFALSKVETNAVLEFVLRMAKTGKTKADLLASVQNQFVRAFAAEDIIQLVNDMISSQLLLSELKGAATVSPLFSKLLETTEKLTGLAESKLLQEVNAGLNSIQKPARRRNKEVLSTIVDKIKELNPSGAGGAVFHCNFIRSFSESAVSTAVVNRVRRAVELIASVNEPFILDEMEAFKYAFIQRYENRYVPLTEVLDEEIGIGYPVGNIRNNNTDGAFEGVRLPDRRLAAAANLRFNPFYTFLFGRISELKAAKGTTLHVSSAKLREFAGNSISLPPTFSVFCTLSSQSAAEVDKGNYIINISNTAYTSASSPINRFAVSDSGIEAFNREIFAYEDQLFENRIVAEVLHMPNARLDNITFRKVTRQFEIPIETLSGHGPDHQVLLDDLLVNVVNQRIRLVRKKDQKEIIPRISNSHPFTNAESLPAYRFLGSLQLHNQQNNLLWLWGPLRNLDFLPRVVLDENLICSLATWRVKLDKIFLSDALKMEERLQSHLFSLGMPRRVSLRQNGDNLLAIDLQDISCLLILIKEFKKDSTLVFHEYLSSEENCLIRDNDNNSYVNELIIPFFEQLKKDEEASKAAVAGQPVITAEKRSFFPGEEFLYLKIYCTKNIGQTILMKSVLKFFSDPRYKTYPMFFIRYEDPDFHLRIRIRKNGNAELIPLMYKALDRFIRNKFIHRIQIDTYHRELDRYALIPYDKTEWIFSFDSKAVLQIIHFLHNSNLEEATWMVAVKNIHAYLLTFGMPAERMVDFCRTVRDGFFQEFDLTDKDFLKSMNQKLKANYRKISALIKETDADYNNLYKILSSRSAAIFSLLDSSEKEKISRNSGACSSYIHMSLNRLFASDERLKEAMCYDLLYNFLVAEKRIARSGKNEIF
jgi:thiopeptide-type bacteriocin biosynthesis protein